MDSSQPRQIILCTGANGSLGFAIIQSLTLHLPNAHFILACRSPTSGQEAITELRNKSILSPIEVLPLDVTNDANILSAIAFVTSRFGKLDILINNAGIAPAPMDDSIASSPSLSLSYTRTAYTTTLSTNLTSIAVLTNAFLPLLRLAPNPRVINVSSARASLTLSTTGNLLPTVTVPYSIFKTALNALAIEMQKHENVTTDRERDLHRDQDREVEEEVEEQDENGDENTDAERQGKLERKAMGGGKVRFYAVSPGHLKTAFNGFRGKKGPVEGAEVVVRLVVDEEGCFEGGTFWEFDEGERRVVPL
jgi:NAD(P)-dependent dehydrogenase (short-subunit alcohol dehydrogenase family)